MLPRLKSWWKRPDTPVTPGPWLIGCTLLTVLALLFKIPAVAAVALIIFVGAMAVRLFWDFAFAAVSFTRTVSAERAFIGDTIDVSVEVVNAKPIPIGRLDVAQTVTPCVPLGQFKGLTGKRTHKTLFTPGMYQRSKQTFTIECNRRGLYTFGPTELVASDMLRFAERQRTDDSYSSFVVYPRLVPLRIPDVAARLPMGDFKPNIPIMEDPSRLAGTRDYVVGDSPNSIHWRATARTGKLQTKINEPSADPMIMIVLDATPSHHNPDLVDNLLELRIMTAATIGEYLLQKRTQVGLECNAPIYLRRRRTTLAPGRGPKQLANLLTKLGEIGDLQGETFQHMLAKINASLPFGVSLIVITSNLDAPLQRVLSRIKQQGSSRPMTVITVGPHAQTSLEFKRTIKVLHVEEEGWDATDAITLRTA